ncbi:MAG: trypsin-like serine protease [Bacteroidetes bacterium]|nr:trypsin-like serine protease [Bacteroidota bacterium]
MKEVIDLYRDVVIQIATPYSTGTGFYLKEPNLIVTNEHVVRDNRVVVIGGNTFAKQLTSVVYLDLKYDLAFLKVPEKLDLPAVQLGRSQKLTEGDQIIAAGHPFGLKYTATQGIISNLAHEQNDVNYIQHDAALNPGNSGGPLVAVSGEVVGVNTFIIKDGNNIGFSLPANYLEDTLKEFKAGEEKIGLRCNSCSNIVFENTKDNGYCPHCGAKATLPSEVEEYEPVGIAKTIETMLEKLGHNVQLSRRGPNNWEMQQGSANISISYYEKTGLIIGDAYLCLLPKTNIKELYTYLLKQNFEVEGLTLSINPQGHDIILSLLIYDRYLNVDTGLKLFQHLFDKADQYDNLLVEKFGALWKKEDFK